MTYDDIRFKLNNGFITIHYLEHYTFSFIKIGDNLWSFQALSRKDINLIKYLIKNNYISIVYKEGYNFQFKVEPKMMVQLL